jgi:hypothetical protein
VSNLETAERMIAYYNAQNLDGYLSLMTDDAAEATYRGAVLRDGPDGIRSGLAAAFKTWPQNKAEICEKQEIGDYVLFREYVTRGPSSDGSPPVEPFEVVAIYSFAGDKCSRVEFVR